jgi:hypothetical protein
MASPELPLSQVSRIVTHAGPEAHFDEFFAIGMLLDEAGDVPVYRRNPTEDELADPGVAVVDVGRRYEPEAGNFDHHQDEDLPSSMVLVARALGHDTLFRSAFPWYQYRNLRDLIGPNRAAEHIGVEGNTRPMDSPLEGYVLKQFAQYRGDDPVGDGWAQIARDFAYRMVDRAGRFARKLKAMRSEGGVETVGGVRTFVVPDHEPDSQVLRALRTELDFEATVTKDPRTGDVAVYRYDGTGLDLRAAVDQIAAGADAGEVGPDRVHFAHNAGFLATVADLPAASAVLSTAAALRTGAEDNGAAA